MGASAIRRTDPPHVVLNHEAVSPSGAHHLLERRLEFFHILTRAYGDAHTGWPDRPDSPDVDLLRSHGLYNFLAGTLHIHHEHVGYRRDKGIVLPAHPIEDIVSDVGDNLTALGDEVLDRQAG